MTFTTAEIVVIIAALSGAIVQIINAMKQSAKTDVIKANTASLMVKAEEIHTQTNSNLKEVKDQLVVADAKIAALTETVTSLKIAQAKK